MQNNKTIPISLIHSKCLEFANKLDAFLNILCLYQFVVPKYEMYNILSCSVLFLDLLLPRTLSDPSDVSMIDYFEMTQIVSSHIGVFRK